MTKTALLLVDIQNDYFPGGKNELQGSLEASQQAQRLLDIFRLRRQPLMHIQHLSIRPGARSFLPGTEGVEIHPNVKPLEGEAIIQKHFPNSFRDTPLLEHLQKEAVTRLVIAGMMTHMCVEATTRAAYDLGFECLVASDACASRELAFEDQFIPAAMVHYAALAALHNTYARAMRTNEIIILLEGEQEQ